MDNGIGHSAASSSFTPTPEQFKDFNNLLHGAQNLRTRLMRGGATVVINNEQQFQQFIQLVDNAMMVRQEWLRKFTDPRRSIDDECGYPSTGSLNPGNIFAYRELYDRDAVANRVVQFYPKEAWQVRPTVTDNLDPKKITPFREAFEGLGEQLTGKRSWLKGSQSNPIWSYLLRADILSGLGSFGIVLLGIADGQSLEMPVQGSVLAANHRGENTPVSIAALDSPMTQMEEHKLLRLPNLNRYERECIGKWHTQRERINELVRARVNNSGPFGDGRIPNISGTFGGYADRGPFSQIGMYTQGFGATIPGSYLSGTDQQYYGVQFGPTEPPAVKPAKGNKLLFVRVFPEDLVQIVRYEWNILNPRFGQPVMYRVTLNDPREQHSGIGLPLATVFVHWSRVVHIVDTFESPGSSEIFGVPRMRPVLNRLLDLQKLYGGSAEMYWRGAFPGLAFETHPELGGDVDLDTTSIQNSMENYMNGLQRYVALTGMRARSIAPQVVDPSPQIRVQLEAIALEKGIPLKKLLGSETGQMAGHDDSDDLNDRLRQRQNTYTTHGVLGLVVDRLILLGVLPEPEGGGYFAKWPDLTNQSEKDKSVVAVGVAKALQSYVQNGVCTLMTPLDFLTHVLKIDPETAVTILDNAKKELPEFQPGISGTTLGEAAVLGGGQGNGPGAHTDEEEVGGSTTDPAPFGRRTSQQTGAKDFQGTP